MTSWFSQHSLRLAAKHLDPASGWDRGSLLKNFVAVLRGRTCDIVSFGIDQLLNEIGVLKPTLKMPKIELNATLEDSKHCTRLHTNRKIERRENRNQEDPSIQ